MKVELTCTHCNCTFQRNSSQVKYNERTGRASKHYCSKSCKGKNVALVGPHNRDELTLFRSIHRNANKRFKDEQLLITVDDLKEQWNLQNSICPYTGIKLNLFTELSRIKRGSDHLNQASLDRIDSSLGYTKDNIQFVSVMANYAKNKNDHETMIKFCKAVAEHWKVL